jgi:hypothetical protein
VTLLHDSITHRQSHIYNTAFNSHIQGSDSEWLLVCDLNEFVYARNGFATITDYLRTIPNDVSCIALPWKLYGSSGFDKHPETGVVSNFTYRDDYEPKGDGKIMNGMCSPGWMTSKYIARISQIINGKRAITGDTALRLAHWFGTSPQFWMNLQALYDVRLAEQQVGTEIRSLPTKPGKPKTDHPRPV